jgi:fructokinase
MTRLFGGIEAGGTKTACVVGTGPDDVRARELLPTTAPEETIGALIRFFEETARHHGRLAALGIASFGPLELRRDRPAFGHILETPKSGWSHIDLVGPFRRAFDVPIAIDTDVNGAALGEGRWGAGRGLSTFVYLTVGTGIGGGGVIDGRPAHGLIHPEMGHLRVPRHPRDEFPGRCPYHADCLEGLACGPAIEDRWGRPSTDLGSLLGDAVELEAHYLALGLAAIVYTVAPERVIVGGGVSKLPGLLPTVRSKLADVLGGYPGLPEHLAGDFVVPPGLGDHSGVAGALALAALAAGT